MKASYALAAALILTGCVNTDKTMVNPTTGQSFICGEVAFGVISSIVGYAAYRKCVDGLVDLGYHDIDDKVPAVPTIPVLMKSEDGHIGLTVQGWDKKPAPSIINQTKSIYAMRNGGEMVLVAIYDDNIDISDLHSYAETMQKVSLSKTSDSVGFPLVPTEISGHPAIRYEYVVTMNGIKFHYQSTIVQFSKETIKVTAWVIESKFQNSLPIFNDLAAGLQENP